jgi:hypothetical protein
MYQLFESFWLNKSSNPEQFMGLFLSGFAGYECDTYHTDHTDLSYPSFFPDLPGLSGLTILTCFVSSVNGTNQTISTNLTNQILANHDHTNQPE